MFITSLRPGDLERYNLEYPALNKLNPGLIYASLTGYGRKGPDRERRGYDVTAFWARSGFMASLREPDSPPVFPRGGLGSSPAPAEAAAPCAGAGPACLT